MPDHDAICHRPATPAPHAETAATASTAGVVVPAISVPASAAGVSVTAEEDDLAVSFLQLTAQSLAISSGPGLVSSGPSDQALTVWTAGDGACCLRLHAGASTEEVDRHLSAHLGAQHSSSTLLPAYPPVEGELHCVSLGAFRSSDVWLVLVSPEKGASRRLARVHSQDSASDILKSVGLADGAFFVAGHSWSGPRQGIHHGLHL